MFNGIKWVKNCYNIFQIIKCFLYKYAKSKYEKKKTYLIIKKKKKEIKIDIRD